jgi:arylformamidase
MNMDKQQKTLRISRSFSDLTHLITEDMPVFPGEPLPKFRRIRTIEKDAVNVTSIMFGSHTGTHVDAPSHFISGGNGVDEIPLDAFVGEAVILDMSKRRNAGITDMDLDSFSGKVIKGDIVLLYTGSSDEWDGAKSGSSDFSYLESSAARWIVRRGIKCVGIDSFSIEKYGSRDGSAHKHLLSRGVGIIENLSSDLKKFADKRMFFVCLPLPLEGLDAAPARAVLFEIPHDGDDAGCTGGVLRSW